MPEELLYKEYIEQREQRYAFTQVDDMIARPPARLLSSGISMIASCTVILIVMSWFVRYPDIIEASFTMSAVDAPVDHFPQTQGYIERQFLYDGARCCAGDSIFYLHNPASISDVEVWRKFLDTVHALSGREQMLSILAPEGLVLGTMQVVYRQLIGAVNKYAILYSQTITEHRSAQIEYEIEATQRLSQSQEQQAELYQKELEVANNTVNRASLLYDDQVISLVELEEAHKSLASTERIFEGMRSTKLQSDVNIARLRSSKYEIEATRIEELTNALFEIRQALNAAESAYELWHDTYFIVALRDGIIVISESIRRNALVGPQSPIATVLPEHYDTQPYAVVMLHGSRAGKIGLGQVAVVRFDAWPYKEYGSLESKVIYKSFLPVVNEAGISFYETHVDIPMPAISTYKKTLQINHRSTGKIRIITEERRVLDRIFRGVFSILQNQ